MGLRLGCCRWSFSRLGGGFGAAAVSVWDKINDTKADIQKVESTVQEAKAGIYKDISEMLLVELLLKLQEFLDK